MWLRVQQRVGHQRQGRHRRALPSAAPRATSAAARSSGWRGRPSELAKQRPQEFGPALVRRDLTRCGRAGALGARHGA